MSSLHNTVTENILKVADVIGETVPFDELRRILTIPAMDLSGGIGFGSTPEEPDVRPSPSSHMNSPVLPPSSPHRIESQKSLAQEIPPFTRSTEEPTTYVSPSQSPSFSSSSLQSHAPSFTRMKVSASQPPSSISSPLQQHASSAKQMSKSVDRETSLSERLTIFTLSDSGSDIKQQHQQLFPAAEVKTNSTEEYSLVQDIAEKLGFSHSKPETSENLEKVLDYSMYTAASVPLAEEIALEEPSFLATVAADILQAVDTTETKLTEFIQGKDDQMPSDAYVLMLLIF